MEWKDVIGYEGLYQVSDVGVIISLGNGESTNSLTKKPRKIIGRVGANGYIKVKLSKSGARRHTLMHRIVAEAFIPNPENKPQVNHINGIKSDNRIENLEWATAKENIRHSIDNGLQVVHKGAESKCSKSVRQIDLNGNIVRVWGSINEVKREKGFNSIGIIKCCKKEKRYKTAYGYRWEYV